MSRWPHILRLVALLLISSGLADFLAFDLADPFAPMNQGELYSQPTFSPREEPQLVGHNLPDDGCLLCGIFVVQNQFTLTPLDRLQTVLSVPTPQLVFSEISTYKRPPKS